MSKLHECKAGNDIDEVELGLLPIDDPALADAWLRSFEAICRRRGLSDTHKERQVTDLFLTRAGLRAVSWAATLVWPLDIEQLQFSNVKKQIVETLQQRQLGLIDSRVNFVSMKQEPDESVRHFAARLRASAAGCEFQGGLEQLIPPVFVAGLRDPTVRMLCLQLFKFPITIEASLGLLEHIQKKDEQQQLQQLQQLQQQQQQQQQKQLSPSQVEDNLPTTSPVKFARLWRSLNCTDSELLCDDDDQLPSLAPPDPEEDTEDDATQAAGDVQEAEVSEVNSGSIGEACAAMGQRNQSNARADEGDTGTQDGEASDSCAPASACFATEVTAAAAAPAETVSTEEEARRASCNSQPVRESISKKFHVHVMSHLVRDICVEADTPDDLELAANNVILLMDELYMELMRFGSPADKKASAYWSPRMAAKTPFRVYEFN